MKLKLTPAGDSLHTQFGIEPDRKAALHTYAFKIYRGGGTKSDNMADLAEVCDNENELAYMMFHYGFICANHEGHQKKGGSSIFSGMRETAFHDLPEFLQEIIMKLIEDDDDEDEDENRKQLWMQGLLTCDCARCSKTRMEMEKKHQRKAPNTRPGCN